MNLFGRRSSSRKATAAAAAQAAIHMSEEACRYFGQHHHQIVEVNRERGSWALVFPRKPHMLGSAPFSITVEPTLTPFPGVKLTLADVEQVLDADPRKGYTRMLLTPHNVRLGVQLEVIHPFVEPGTGILINGRLDMPRSSEKWVTLDKDTRSLVFYMACNSDATLCDFLDDWIRAWRGEERRRAFQ
jgi:hypothetical protein